MSEKLRLNRETGMMEMVLTISIDRKAHLRRLVAYIEENNIDYTDLSQYQKALDKVSSLYEWQNHPDARIVFGQQEQQPKQIEQPKPREEKSKVDYSVLKRYSNADADEFSRRLLDTPIEEWESLKTPILPNTASDKERNTVYQIRNDQKKIMERLLKEMEPASLEKLQVVAELTNGARHK